MVILIGHYLIIINLMIHPKHVDLLRIRLLVVKHHKNIIKGAAHSESPFFLFLQYSKIHTDSVTKVARKFDDLDESFFTDSQRKINVSKFPFTFPNVPPKT